MEKGRMLSCAYTWKLETEELDAHLVSLPREAGQDLNESWREHPKAALNWIYLAWEIQQNNTLLR